MNQALLRTLYFRLPPSTRSVAATLQGAYLRWWRYGAASERLAEEATRREYWSVAQWDAWRQERLAFVLHRAATRVPYYREQWAERRRRGDRASWDVLENWPILEKETLRQNARALVADDRSVRRLFHVRTSGTTGTPLHLWRSRETLQAMYAIGLARTRGWNGLTLKDRRAMVGGQLVTPVAQRRPPFWVWNAALRQLYMSSYHLAPDAMRSYFDALVKYRIVYVVGYSSSLYTMAAEALRTGYEQLSMIAAITNAEPLFDVQREAIQAAFHCPVEQTYGMAENVASATECSARRLHLWPEVGLTEVCEGDRPVAPGAPGDLVCTGMLNADMPLIRYRVGDSGRLASDAAPCACGRTMPVLASLDGRTTDLLWTAEGRRVFWMNPVLYGLPLREAQIIQETLHLIRVRYVSTTTAPQDLERTLARRVRERMGDVEVVVERVSAIPRGANGKFRAVVCNVSAAEREQLGRPLPPRAPQVPTLH